MGGPADGDAAGPGRGLQPRGDVHDVADDRVSVAHLAGEDLTRVDAHAKGEARAGGGLDVRVDLLHRGLHREAGADGTLGVVLVGDRSTEHGHDVVADVLVHRPAVAHDLLPKPAKRAVDERLHRLRVEPLGDGRVAGEVGEQHRRLAPLLGQRATTGPPAAGLGGDPATEEPRALAARLRGRLRWGRGGRRRCRRGGRARTAQRSAALDAELGARRALGAARGAPGRELRSAGHAEAGARGILGAAVRASLSSHVTNDTWPPRTLRENRHALQADRRASRRARWRRPCAQAPRAASMSAAALPRMQFVCSGRTNCILGIE